MGYFKNNEITKEDIRREFEAWMDMFADAQLDEEELTNLFKEWLENNGLTLMPTGFYSRKEIS